LLKNSVCNPPDWHSGGACGEISGRAGALAHPELLVYNDDWELPSKRMFSFLMFIFSLVETGGKEGAPIVTIPAG
jgi:hypothetical protein